MELNKQDNCTLQCAVLEAIGLNTDQIHQSTDPADRRALEANIAVYRRALAKLRAMEAGSTSDLLEADYITYKEGKYHARRYSAFTEGKAKTTSTGTTVEGKDASSFVVMPAKDLPFLSVAEGRVALRRLIAEKNESTMVTFGNQAAWRAETTHHEEKWKELCRQGYASEIRRSVFIPLIETDHV